MDMKSVFTEITDAFNPDARAGLMPLDAIWLVNPVAIKDQRGNIQNTVRLKRFYKIRVVNNLIVDCSDTLAPTHKIVECIGNIGSSHMFFILQQLPISEKNCFPEILKVK